MISQTALVIQNATQHECFDYAASEGYFFSYSIKTERMGFHRQCREEWSWVWKSAPYIGFTCPTLNIKRFNTCWTALERKLGLTEPTIIRPVVCDHRDGEHKADTSAIILQINPFWTKTSTHRSILTLFIRLAGKYYQGKYRGAVQSYALANLIENKLDWFLAGNTRPTYTRVDGGIVDKLKYKSMDEVKTMLVKPEAVTPVVA
jgi:hypothetical protein